MNSPKVWLKRKQKMKIRIKGNSIRYRLTKSEVEIFCKTGRFEETTDFGNTIFTYVLEAKEGIHTLDAQFQNNTITLFLEKKTSENWFETNQIGFRHSIQKANGATIQLLIEKDFVCMDETVEDQSDNYPNPKMDNQIEASETKFSAASSKSLPN